MDVSSERIAVELLLPSPEWTARARAEVERLGPAIGNCLVAIHHIGSTSIPGIKAKPTVDLLPLVTDIAALDQREGAVTALGYEWMGEFGLPGRRFLRLSRDGKRLFNVHCYEASNPEVTRHIAFRDYLRAHRDVAKEYEAEKIRAAALHPDDVLLYNDAKDAWIKRTERLALDWHVSRMAR
jgi:GrpB-like predicted nucleotidyltransferase (UPF0157 family)